MRGGTQEPRRGEDMGGRESEGDGAEGRRGEEERKRGEVVTPKTNINTRYTELSPFTSGSSDYIARASLSTHLKMRSNEARVMSPTSGKSSGTSTTLHLI